MLRPLQVPSANNTCDIYLHCDVLSHQLGVLREPIKYTVKKGRVVAIEGGEQAAKLRELIQGIPDADNLAEMALDTNRKARLTGCLAEDKKIYGSAHVALGNNLYYGGKINCEIHYDSVLLGVTIRVDGVTLVDKGRVVVWQSPR